MAECDRFRLVEANVSELRAALDAGVVTSVEQVAAFLNRIAFYDRQGLRLNAVPVLNPDMFAEACAADERRSKGEALSPLDGIPYTAKNSCKVEGLTVAAGSPAFAELVAHDDAFAIGQLRAAGAVLIGLTNMPPMAAGGMQRGLYGRAERPYSPHYLTAAFGSGSSNGSGTATAACFAAFGLGEEMVVRACTGFQQWPGRLYPVPGCCLSTRQLVAGAHDGRCRSAYPVDGLELLNVLVADDSETRGDFWRVQPWVPVPRASKVRPADYRDLGNKESLRGKRLGIPRMYINGDSGSAYPIFTRASVIELWNQSRRDIESLGAEGG